MSIYEILEFLNIEYEEIEHEAVFTVEEAKRIENMLDGVGGKNLFLKDGKQYYLYILIDNKKADLKALSRDLKVSHLKFASEEELFEFLKLRKGEVTPFGIINDVNNQVILIIDKELVGKTILCHPNVNTKTISIKYEDLIKFIEYEKHKYLLY